MSIIDNTAQTWRDLVGELTPGQVARLEWCERGDQVPPDISSPEGQLSYARMMAQDNTLQALYADVPTPPDAVQVDQWTILDDDQFCRYFDSWRHHQVPAVSICGIQYHDARVEREVSCDLGNAGNMTADQARQLATALVEAADALEAAEATEARR